MKNNVWRLIAHHHDPEGALLTFRRHERIAIGWNDVGDLRQLSPACASDITAMIRDRNPDLTSAHLGGPSLWRFYREMQRGDLVILGDGHRRRSVMQVVGDYAYDVAQEQSVPAGYRHWRSARLSAEQPEQLWERCGATWAIDENSRWTLFRCGDPK